MRSDEVARATSLRNLVPEVGRIGREVARPAARAVDAEARFPTETLSALKACGALGAAVPVELGGAGLGLAALAESCSLLGQHCASSAMILAMHHIQVACLVQHRGRSAATDRYLRRVASEQRLIASVTSEVGTGGDMRSSIVAIEEQAGRFRLAKRAPTVSYGSEADDLLVTARRHGGASPHDQVLVLLLGGEYVLTPTGVWDALGMRGTCSLPANIEGGGAAWQILPDPFGDVAAHTMVPVSHVLWASCWLGVATDAVAIARGKVRSEARAGADGVPPAAQRLAEAGAKLQLLRSEVTAAAAEYERLRAEGDRAELGSLAAALRMNNLKLSASRLSVEIAADALAVCGIAGYRNDSPHSVGRQLRDVLSAPLMIQNQRLLETNAALWMVGKWEP
jgi:acyl-CoA dehydrogenase